MDQLIVLLVVAVVVFVKWFIENAGKSRDDESAGTPPPSQSRPSASRYPRPNPSIPSPRAESDEEKVRRFLEALGLPKDSIPPPLPKPVVKPAIKRPERPPALPAKSEPRPKSVRTKIAPPLETGNSMPNLPKTAPVNEAAPSMEVTSIPQMNFMDSERAVQAAGEEVAAMGLPARKSSPSTSGQPVGLRNVLMEQLRTPASLRNAILLREILGSPKGLHSAQTHSIFSPL